MFLFCQKLGFGVTRHVRAALISFFSVVRRPRSRRSVSQSVTSLPAWLMTELDSTDLPPGRRPPPAAPHPMPSSISLALPALLLYCMFVRRLLSFVADS